MSARAPQLCEGIAGDHEGPIRPYACGPRCSAHSPWAERQLPEPGPVPRKATVVQIARRPASGMSVRDVIFVDVGEGYVTKKGDRAGQVWWKREPRARFECLPCQYASPIVTGADEVRAFVAGIRTSHRASCPGRPAEQQQAA